MPEYWEEYIIVVDASDIRDMEGYRIVKGEWYTRDEYENHDHAQVWHNWAKVAFLMDEDENLSITAVPFDIPLSSVGYRILD